MFEIIYIGVFVVGFLLFLLFCILLIVLFYLSYFVGVGVNCVEVDVFVFSVIKVCVVLLVICFVFGVIMIFMGFGVMVSMFG